MQIGMIGIGRMGGDMVRRLLQGGHECVLYGTDSKAVEKLAGEGATGAKSLAELVDTLAAPRIVWLMIPAAAVDGVITDIVPFLESGDILVDGGNSHYHDDLRRSAELQKRGIRYLDVGTSGGVWGRERGYCLMVGGESDAVASLNPIFATLAPGIEYGLMAAYAEGFNILRHANIGQAGREADAETAPLRNPEHFRYDFNLADISELWRRGSVVSSWLLDLSARAFAENPALDGYAGRVSDSGEGRWTISAAIEAGVPTPVLSTALYERFSSRGEADFANRLLSAMRYQFGGHQEKPGTKGV